METKIRFNIQTSGNQDVFAVTVYGFSNGRRIGEANTMMNDLSANTNFEVNFGCNIDCIIITFEEHWKFREYRIDVSENQVGIRFIEKADPHDEPTYAGSYEFLHPIFDYGIVDYNSIFVNTTADINLYE